MKRRPKEKWLRSWTDRELEEIDKRARAIRQEDYMPEETAWYNAEREMVERRTDGRIQV